MQIEPTRFHNGQTTLKSRRLSNVYYLTLKLRVYFLRLDQRWKKLKMQTESTLLSHELNDVKIRKSILSIFVWNQNGIFMLWAEVFAKADEIFGAEIQWVRQEIRKITLPFYRWFDRIYYLDYYHIINNYFFNY